jgi:hypothetical protein
MRSALAALLVVAACGPSGGTDEACTREDVVTSGALVQPGREECSPCDLEDSYVLITLETTCEAGVEWPGSYRLIDYATAENLTTGERFLYEAQLGQPAERLWRVAPGEPYTGRGPYTAEIVTEPGNYSFRLELLHELMAVEFEGSVE